MNEYCKVCFDELQKMRDNLGALQDTLKVFRDNVPRPVQCTVNTVLHQTQVMWDCLRVVDRAVEEDRDS